MQPENTAEQTAQVIKLLDSGKEEIEWLMSSEETRKPVMKL